MSRYRTVYVVAEYTESPAEGMQVLAKALVGRLRQRGRTIRVLAPGRLWSLLRTLVARRSDAVLFLHGPGLGVLRWSRLLRRWGRPNIVWVATRPELPVVEPGAPRAAHLVIANRANVALTRAAPDATFVHAPIGIERREGGRLGLDPWADSHEAGRRVVLHVGHLRSNRGLHRLVELKRLLNDSSDVALVASPTFEHDPEIRQDLLDAGVRVLDGYIPDLSSYYAHADLYLFPADPDQQGAIELPLSILEALHQGCPVVSTAFGAVPELLGDASGITIVAPQNLVTTVVRSLEAAASHAVQLPEAFFLDSLIDVVERELG